MEHSKTWLLMRDIASIEEAGKEVTSELLNQTTLMSFDFIGSRYLTPATQPHQQTHIPSVYDHDTSHPYDTCLSSFPMHSFLHVSHSYCQGITPSNSKGGLPAPEARARVREGGIRDEIDPSPSRSKSSQDKAEPRTAELTQLPEVVEGRARLGGPT